MSLTHLIYIPFVFLFGMIIIIFGSFGIIWLFDKDFRKECSSQSNEKTEKKQ